MMRAFHHGQCSGQAMALMAFFPNGIREEQMIKEMNERRLGEEEEAKFHSLVGRIRDATIDFFEGRLEEKLKELE